MMSSLYIGATGLKTHGEGMSVVTNNLSNVNTVGFKQVMMVYQDLISSSQTADSNMITNMSQVGMGARVGDVRRLFTEGGFETGSEATDMAINGSGFFGVQKNGIMEFTRAGNFRFTKDGDLLDPSGWNLVGHAMDANGNESPDVTPIKLNLNPDGLGTLQPKATTMFTAIAQVGGVANTVEDQSNPFFAMLKGWNGQAAPPISMYGATDHIELYDSAGNLHKATIYLDNVGVRDGARAMEYLVAMDNPDEDDSALKGTNAAGLLMAGTLSFNSSGQLQNMTGFAPPASGDFRDLNLWAPAGLANGAPAFTAKFSGADAQTVGLDMGMTLTGSAGGSLANAASAAANPGAVYDAAPGGTRKESSTTAFGNGPIASVMQKNDGYTVGHIRNMTVNPDGIIEAQYSNGQNKDLARVSLYRFTSNDGLRAEGSNHFSAAPEAGAVEEGKPGTSNYGTIAERVIEQSNVDYAREFTTMIITQRGFQMNSKVVTTSDQMLQKALELKR